MLDLTSLPRYIYSADAEQVKLYTHRKQYFYVDQDELLRQKYIRQRQLILDRIAQCLGYKDFDSLDTFTRCCGVTYDVLMTWIEEGSIAENVAML